ncbi:MAG: S8 family serine peptidase, partial [Spirochaetota bacterium]
MKRTLRLLSLALLVVFAIAACSAPFTVNQAREESSGPQFSRAASRSGGSAELQEYLIVGVDTLPSGLERSVERLGGAVLSATDEVGLAVVALPDARGAGRVSRISGVRSVIPNATVNWLPGERYFKLADEVELDSVDPSDDALAGLLWGLDAINAPEAWAAGATGEGVTVAVLDSGIDPGHPDLVDNISPLSASLVADEPYLNDGDGHGTHVAGTIAAVDNDLGVIGAAPDVEILAVKVLGATGSGSFGDVLNGILYAHAAGADVINMSLGALLQRRGLYDENGVKVVNANEISELVNIFTRVINYVHTNGTLVVSSAGNDALNSTGDAGIIYLPADAGRTISVSATGPLGWGLDPTTDLDVPAFYTNYGSSIDLAAPGGNVDFSLYPDPATLWFYDLVLSTYSVYDPATETTSRGYAWLAGTSMAAPHVAAVAALIIDAHDGEISPSQVETILRQSADDLGKPGNDPYYG